MLSVSVRSSLQPGTAWVAPLQCLALGSQCASLSVSDRASVTQTTAATRSGARSRSLASAQKLVTLTLLSVRQASSVIQNK